MHYLELSHWIQWNYHKSVYRIAVQVVWLIPNINWHWNPKHTYLGESPIEISGSYFWKTCLGFHQKTYLWNCDRYAFSIAIENVHEKNKIRKAFPSLFFGTNDMSYTICVVNGHTSKEKQLPGRRRLTMEEEGNALPFSWNFLFQMATKQSFPPRCTVC